MEIDKQELAQWLKDNPPLIHDKNLEEMMIIMNFEGGNCIVNLSKLLDPMMQKVMATRHVLQVGDILELNQDGYEVETIKKINYRTKAVHFESGKGIHFDWLLMMINGTFYMPVISSSGLTDIPKKYKINGVENLVRFLTLAERPFDKLDPYPMQKYSDQYGWSRWTKFVYKIRNIFRRD